MAISTALEWLAACAGCEMAILDIGEELLPLLTEELDIVHAPLLLDHKYFGQTGEAKNLSIPNAQIGIVSGGLNTEEHLQVLIEMRDKCELLIALGTCAAHGGIPALMNGQQSTESWQEIFSAGKDDYRDAIPDCEVPAPLDRVYACDEKVKIDFWLPGCPPNPEHILELIRSVLEKREPQLPRKSVCDTCPVIREGSGKVKKINRSLKNVHFKTGEPLSAMRCLLEQGHLCLGPVTLAGCARSGAPGCIVARVPCRGCFGPVRKGGNQLLDMMNALASNGIDYSSVVDRRSLLRFSGAHGLLKPPRIRNTKS